MSNAQPIDLCPHGALVSPFAHLGAGCDRRTTFVATGNLKHEELTAEELAGIELFEGLPESELRSCAALMQRTEVLMGNKLTTEADFGYSFFVVLKGKVRVSAGDEALAELAAGDYFGEVSLVQHDKRNATVVALETCELAKLMAWNFDTFKNVSPKLGERLEVAAGERSTPSE